MGGMGEWEEQTKRRSDRKNKPPRPEKMIFLLQNSCGSGLPSFKEKEGKFLQYMFYLDVL